MEVACRLVDDLAQLVAGGEVVDGRRTGLCQLSGSGNICERAILVSGNTVCLPSKGMVKFFFGSY